MPHVEKSDLAGSRLRLIRNASNESQESLAEKLKAFFSYKKAQVGRKIAVPRRELVRSWENRGIPVHYVPLIAEFFKIPEKYLTDQSILESEIRLQIVGTESGIEGIEYGDFFQIDEASTYVQKCPF